MTDMMSCENGLLKHFGGCLSDKSLMNVSFSKEEVFDGAGFVIVLRKPFKWM